jgi:UDP-N-acetylmuramate--alanine ligase
VGIEVGIEFNRIKGALETVEGVQRRMETKGEKAGITVVDDYGHHPTEIKATLQGIKNAWPGRRLVVIFQPHRHTRTTALFREFTRSFYESDLLYVLDIYSAGEDPVSELTAKDLCDGIREHGHKHVCYAKGEPAKMVSRALESGDIVLTLGAGDVWKVGMEILELLK